MLISERISISKQSRANLISPSNANFELESAEVSILHLKSQADITQIAHLRQQINLDAAAAIDPFFLQHEKKEMS